MDSLDQTQIMEIKRAKQDEDEEEEDEENDADEEDEEDEENDADEEDEEDEENDEEEDEANDVVYQFLEKVNRKEIKFVITANAFNKMCGMDAKGEFIRITSNSYWAYGELQLVWRDVMERLNSNKYKAKTIVIESFQAKTFYCSFKYKDVHFYADNAGKTWTICLMEER